MTILGSVLSEAEIEASSAFVAARYPRYTLVALCEWWHDFVTEVKEGYAASIDDYLNNLGVRDIIEDILTKIEPGITHKVMPLIEQDDREFYSVTKRRRVGTWGEPEWSNRLPIRPVGDLLDDMRANGEVE